MQIKRIWKGKLNMSNKGKSVPDIFGGGYTHYDSKGHKTGRSEPGLFGGFTDYDAKGNKIGRSERGIFGGYTHYDNHGNKTGRSEPSLFGGYTEFDAKGHVTGHTDPTLFGGYTHTGKGANHGGVQDDFDRFMEYEMATGGSGNEGCYIATCVYGSYDCPEVMVLRRFRDNVLKKSLPGRAFVKTYYALSPTAVRLFGNTKPFRVFWRTVLDKFIKELENKQEDRL